MAVCPRATGAIIRAGGDRPTGPSADSVRGTLGQARHEVKKPRQEAGAWSGPETEFIEALLLVLFHRLGCVVIVAELFIATEIDHM